jgi:hypothetical protein
MENNSTLIALSAFSGLAGAVLTQALTGLFGYLGDKRKAKLEIGNLFRQKQIEIAENFYYVTGETMSVLSKSIEHWKDRNKPRSEASITYFNIEMKRLDVYMEKMKADNWKHSLIALYFDVSLSYNELIAANMRSHLLYLSLLDIAENINEASSDEEKEKLVGNYHVGIFDLCSQYDNIYNMLKSDMYSVKTELLRTFQVK